MSFAVRTITQVEVRIGIMAIIAVEIAVPSVARVLLKEYQQYGTIVFS
jgi:hypothetical protein